MRNNLLFMLLGISISISIASTTLNISKVIVEKPRYTAVLIGGGMSDIKAQIEKSVKQGYVVKSIAGAGRYGDYWIAVVEKY